MSSYADGGSERLLLRIRLLLKMAGEPSDAQIGVVDLALLILSGAMLTVVPACAQTYDPNFPVCMKVIVMDGGEHYDCSFTSLA